MNLPAAVLWDMDGTLVDTEPYWMDAEHRLVAEHGNGQWSSELAHQIVGRDLRDSARFIQRHGGVNMAVDDIVHWLLASVVLDVRQRIPWRPGALDLLDDLRAANVPCALVTMSWRSLASAIVDQLPPGTFAAVVTGDDVDHGKPHPEPYLTAARSLWVEPQQCIAIEDSPTGTASALAAGCATIGVPHMVPIEPQPNLTLVTSLREVDMPFLRRQFVAAPTPTTLSTPPDPFDTLADAGDAPTPPDRALAVRDRLLSGPASRLRYEVARLDRRQLLIGGGALVAVGAAAALILGRDDEPPPAPDIPISAWVPYWQLTAATSSLRSNSGMLTAVSPFWFEINETSGANTVAVAPPVAKNADTQRRANELIDIARGRHLQVLPSIVDQLPAGAMAAVMADPAARRTHVAAITNFVRTGEFDGIDIDYEKFAFSDGKSTWLTTRPLFSAFVGELASALHGIGKLLTVTVPYILDDGGQTDRGFWVYDYAELIRHVDQLRMMAYDYSSSKPGPVSPINWVSDLVRAAKRVTDAPHKLSLGVPMYGYSWPTAITGACPDGTPTGRVAITQRGLDDLVQRRSAVAASGELAAQATADAEQVYTYTAGFPDTNPTCHQEREIHMVTAADTRVRIDLARRERLGGVSLWALGFDDQRTWDEIAALARRAAAGTTPGT